MNVLRWNYYLEMIEVNILSVLFWENLISCNLSKIYSILLDLFALSLLYVYFVTNIIIEYIYINSVIVILITYYLIG